MFENDFGFSNLRRAFFLLKAAIKCPSFIEDADPGL